MKTHTASSVPYLSAVLLCAVVLAGCASAPDTVGRRVEALSDAAWRDSVWIAAAGAPTIEAKHRWDRTVLTAPGTSAFATTLVNPAEVTRARWMTAGLGVYELFVNGSRIGTDALRPGFTHGYRTKYAFTYDVTDAFRCGAGETNRLAAEVSSGWWRDISGGYMGTNGAFRAVLELTFADGTTKTFGTNARDWRAGVGGPVVSASIFGGETYDARIAPIFDTPETLATPLVSDEFAGELLPSAGAEVCRREDLSLSPVAAYCWKGVTDAATNRYGRVVKTRVFAPGEPLALAPGETLVVDFGQNCAAVPDFRFSAPAGTVLTALPAEMLNDAAGEHARGNDGPGGSVYRANLRIAEKGMRLVYTFAGAGEEAYTPRYTYFGYRYLSLTATAPVTIGALRSVPLTSIAACDETGTLATGDADVNRLVSNVRWGQLSNYLSIPTDCPQRDERQGWTADTQVFAETGAYNADTYAFMRKFLRDLRDSQLDNTNAYWNISPWYEQSYHGAYPCVAPWGHYGTCGAGHFGWSDCGIILPYVLWRHFGKTAHLAEHWDSMVWFMDWLKENRYAKDWTAKHQCADWLSCEAYETCSGRNHAMGADGKNHLKPEAALYWKFLGGCYWLMDARMMAKMAAALGKADAAKTYSEMAAAARHYLRDEVLENGRLPACLRGMQTPALFALHCGLLDADEAAATKEALLKNIRAHGDCLQTGFLGTSILMDTLTEIGASDVAYTLLLQHKNPSWLYSVDQGATTVWERWNSYTKRDGFGPVGMNSFNHYAYGCVVAWLYKTAAGIAATDDAPGFRTVVMAPKPDRRLGFVKAAYRSAAGLVESAWRYEGDEWIWTFTIPDGATARVTVPGEKPTTYPAGTHMISRHWE